MRAGFPPHASLRPPPSLQAKQKVVNKAFDETELWRKRVEASRTRLEELRSKAGCVDETTKGLARLQEQEGKLASEHPDPGVVGGWVLGGVGCSPRPGCVGQGAACVL